MRFDAGDKSFNVIDYLRFSDRDDSEVGKYNAGQKFFFWMVLVTTLLLLLTGIVLWWPNYFGQGLRSASILLHDICFIGFFMADRRAHLPRHRGGAGNLPLHDPRHRHASLGEAAPPPLVPGSDG